MHSDHDSPPPDFLQDGDGGARRIAKFVSNLATTSRKRARKGTSAAIKYLDDKMRRFFWLHLPQQVRQVLQAGMSFIYFPPIIYYKTFIYLTTLL